MFKPVRMSGSLSEVDTTREQIVQEVRRAEVVPAQAHGEGQVRTELPAVLEEEAPPGYAGIFAYIGWNTGRVEGFQSQQPVP